jgi:hypothetical protein
MVERLKVDHVTIRRCDQKYAPELQRRCRALLKWVFLNLWAARCRTEEGVERVEGVWQSGQLLKPEPAAFMTRAPSLSEGLPWLHSRFSQKPLPICV